MEIKKHFIVLAAALTLDELTLIERSLWAEMETHLMVSIDQMEEWSELQKKVHDARMWLIANKK